MDSARILVTGGCGLQGSHIVEQLISAYPNCKITVFSRKPDINRFPGVEYIAGSTASREDVRKAVDQSKPTVVFHVAGLNANAPVAPEVMRAVNLDATGILLEESKRAGAKAFIYTSSSSVVHGVNGAPIHADILNADETWPTQTDPNSGFLHSYAKAESERQVKQADTPSGMRTAVVRPALIYGERDTTFVPIYMSYLETGKTDVRLGDGKDIKSFTYAGNAAKFQISLAERLLSNPEGAAGETFFNTDKEQIGWYDFLRLFWSTAGHEQPDGSFKTIPRSEALEWVTENLASVTHGSPEMAQMFVGMSMMTRCFDNGKAERALGWKQPLSQKEGVERTVKWYLANKSKT